MDLHEAVGQSGFTNGTVHWLLGHPTQAIAPPPMASPPPPLFPWPGKIPLGFPGKIPLGFPSCRQPLPMRLLPIKFVLPIRLELYLTLKFLADVPGLCNILNNLVWKYFPASCLTPNRQKHNYGSNQLRKLL